MIDRSELLEIGVPAGVVNDVMELIETELEYARIEGVRDATDSRLFVVGRSAIATHLQISESSVTRLFARGMPNRGTKRIPRIFKPEVDLWLKTQNAA